jgi:hypothetical protein
MKVYRKITNILSYSMPSYHDNIDYHVKLECGHVAIRTYKRGTNPIKKRTVCHICSKIDDFSKLSQQKRVIKELGTHGRKT